MKLTNNILLGSVVLLVLVSPMLAAPICQKNEYYNSATRKCESCEQCPIGTGRDFNTARMKDEHGMPQCLPCQQCDSGYYSDARTNKCRRCRKSCKDLHRQVAMDCSADHEAVCGSCLSGYKDEYDSERFPCQPIQHINQIVTAGVPNNNFAILTPNETSLSMTSQQSFDQKASSSGSNMILTVVPILLVVALIITIITVITVFVRRFSHIYNHVGGSRSTSDSSLESKSSGQYDEKIPLTEERLDTDGLTDRPLDGPHPEISTVQPSGPPGLPGRSEMQNQPCIFKCGDKVPSSCDRCEVITSFNAFSNVKVDKSTKYVQRVSELVCHNENLLYDQLGIPQASIYQNEDDRNVNTEAYSKQRVVYNILSIWVEKQGSGARLNTLLIALCQSGFHKITEQLINIYNDSRKQERFPDHV